MLTLGIAAFSAQSTTSAYARTKARMEAIKEALLYHLAVHDRLPCPDKYVAGVPFDG